MSETTTSKSAKKSGLLSGLLGGGKSYFVLALVAALFATGGVLTLLGQAAATTTYYVLTQDVPARTQITEALLAPVQTSLGGEPRNALDLVDIQEANAEGGPGAFALLPLQAGDVLSSSTVGPLDRISANLPDGFVAASFALTPENAVAGKIRRGDYIDVIAVSDSTGDAGSTSKVVLHHVLVLDVTVAPETIADAATSGQAGADVAPGPESAAVRGGIPSLYVVGLSAEDAVKLALVRDKNLMIVLSANQTTGALDAQEQLGNVFGPDAVSDSGAGTAGAAATAAGTDGVPADGSATPSGGAAAPATESGGAAATPTN